MRVQGLSCKRNSCRIAIVVGITLQFLYDVMGKNRTTSTRVHGPYKCAPRFESKCTHQLVTINLQTVRQNNNYKTATTTVQCALVFGCVSFYTNSVLLFQSFCCHELLSFFHFFPLCCFQLEFCNNCYP